MADFNLKMDLSELTLETLASMPRGVRLACIALTCVCVTLAIFMLDTKRQIKALAQTKQIQLSLKQTYEQKHMLAANLIPYQQQLAAIKHDLAALLKQLPNQTEVSGLLEDVSELGHANGLTFSLFKPMPEKMHDFYADLPIRINVRGAYHQYAKFVSDVSALNRIVTINDFKIKQAAPVSANATATSTAISSDTLSIELTAHTYRYVNKVRP